MKQSLDFAVFVLGVSVFLFSAVPSATALEATLRNANKITREYRDKLKELEQWCESQGLADEAERIRFCVPPQADDKIYIPKLPLKVQTPPKRSTPDTSTPETPQRDWEKELYDLQKDYAQKLFAHAKTAAKKNRGSLAIDMALAALHADPDHAAIRRLLGFVRYKDEWRTPWEAEQLRKGRIDHPRFGWVLEKNVPKYAAGERLHEKKWISEEEDAQNRKKIADGWAIESEHYVVLTNHSIEEGVRATRRLEDLYRAWKLLFYRYMASDKELASLFEGRGTPKPPSRRHAVWLFRNKDDYVATLSPSQPFAKNSLGFYAPGFRRCYFFSVGPQATRDEKEDVDRTLLHEATHQLFSEAKRTRQTAGNMFNFWILEGIAMYMETLSSSGGYYTIGGTDDIRFQNAVDEVLTCDFYIPFEKLTVLGRNEFQNVSLKVLPSLYAQSAGCAHFLMHAEEGEFRDATVVYLRLIYDEKDDHLTLSKLTSLSYGELDKKYRKYLEENKRR